jgi:hypothetical protein
MNGDRTAAGEIEFEVKRAARDGYQEAPSLTMPT